MRVPYYREIELTISRQNVIDQVAAMLYAAGIVHDNEEVIDIEFKEVLNKGVTLSPIKICLKRHQEVDLIEHI